MLMAISRGPHSRDHLQGVVADHYKIEDVENGLLRTPSSLPELASLEISPEYLDKAHFRNAPKVEIGADGIPRYHGEGDEAEFIPMQPPLSPTFEPSQAPSGRTQKRFVPYRQQRANPI